MEIHHFRNLKTSRVKADLKQHTHTRNIIIDNWKDNQGSSDDSSLGGGCNSVFYLFVLIGGFICKNSIQKVISTDNQCFILLRYK